MSTSKSALSAAANAAQNHALIRKKYKEKFHSE